MVEPDADCGTLLAAEGYQLAESVAGLLVHPCEIARIDADLVGYAGHGESHIRREVDIRYEGRINALRAESLLDACERLHLLHSLGGEPYELRSGAVHFAALGHGGLHILGGGVAHSLDYHGRAASQMHKAFGMPLDGSAYIETDPFHPTTDYRRARR